jgi:hypothetical protein
MNNILLIFLGVVLLIFCVVDLWHLKEMLKEIRMLNIQLRIFIER